jgi:hypothetical protein
MVASKCYEQSARGTDRIEEAIEFHERILDHLVANHAAEARCMITQESNQ